MIFTLYFRFHAEVSCISHFIFDLSNSFILRNHSLQEQAQLSSFFSEKYILGGMPNLHELVLTSILYPVFLTRKILKQF